MLIKIRYITVMFSRVWIWWNWIIIELEKLVHKFWCRKLWQVRFTGTISQISFTSCIKCVAVELSEGRSVPRRSLQPAGVVFPSLSRMFTIHGHQVRCSDSVWKVFFSISCKISSQINTPFPTFASASKQVFVQNHSFKKIIFLASRYKYSSKRNNFMATVLQEGELAF